MNVRSIHPLVAFLLALLLISCSDRRTHRWGAPSKSAASITEEDRGAIKALVAKETAKKILRITAESSDVVEVHTGVITPGRLDGKGEIFKLKRTNNGWKIETRGLWVS